MKENYINSTKLKLAVEVFILKSYYTRPESNEEIYENVSRYLEIYNKDKIRIKMSSNSQMT